MPDELTNDLMPEVKGVIRSIPVRARLVSELSVGEAFELRGRRWVVSSVDRVDRQDLDRRVVAREVDETEIAA
jgi:hypothetical protein